MDGVFGEVFKAGYPHRQDPNVNPQKEISVAVFPTKSGRCKPQLRPLQVTECTKLIFKSKEVAGKYLFQATFQRHNDKVLLLFVCSCITS